MKPLIIPKPQKAPTEPINLRQDLHPDAEYYVQPKYDGIRIKFHDGTPYTNTGKRIPNLDVEAYLISSYRIWGFNKNLDGELLFWNEITNRWESFNDTQSIVMSKRRIPVEVQKQLRFIVFDYDDGNKYDPYHERLFQLVNCLSGHTIKQDTICLVEYAMHLPIPGKDVEQIEQAAQYILKQGYEGAMIRNAKSPYYYGKLPASTDVIRKYVEWERDEATIVGSVEGTRNLDTSTKRKENMYAANRLGALIVRHPRFGQFEIGSGFNDLQRDTYWRERDSMVGKLVTFKYRPEHMKDVPCPAIFIGIRSEEDISI